MNQSPGEKLWKRRAQNALGNPSGISTFRTASTTTSLTIVITFYKMQKPAKTSVASLRRLITPTRNADHDQPGTLITFIGIRTKGSVAFRAFFFQFAMHTSESSRRVGCPRVLPQENLADTLWLQKRVQAGPGTQVSEYPTRLRAHAV